MRTALTFLFLLCSISHFVSQTVFDWAFSGGGSSTDHGHCVTTDSRGNIFIIADFIGEVTYGDYFLFGNSYSGALVAKHSPNGSLLWVNFIEAAHSGGISVDAEGNCYVTGDCGNSKFYNKENPITVVQKGNGDAFIAKYDGNGSLMWVKLSGYATTHDRGAAIKTNTHGDSYIVGNHDNFSSGNFSFISKYDKDGNLIWTNSNLSGHLSLTDIEVDEQSNFYLTGVFSDSLIVGSNTLTATPSNYSILIAKYDSNGNNIWANKTGTNNDRSNSISIDGKGNIFITGYYVSPSQFGNTQLHNATTGKGAMFIAKYDNSGMNLWAKTGTESTRGFGLFADAEGSCLVTGHFVNTAILGENNNAITLSACKANADIFAAKYDQYGNIVWAIAPKGGTWESNYGASICADSEGNCYLTGGFSGITVFGDTTLNAPQNTAGYGDIFLVKINTSSFTSIKDNSSQTFSEFTIFPNPTTGAVQMNCSLLQNCNISISIIDSRGQKVFLETKQVAKGTYSKVIDLSKFASGVYFIQLEADRTKAIKKIVID